ncbi:Tyrosine recombinase XerC [Brachybacterium faecium]|nr:Tyrosine recombinase XerC [Brachybacterium faecium]
MIIFGYSLGMSSADVPVPHLQPTADLDTLRSRWLGTLAPTTRSGYSADARAWLSYAYSEGIDPKTATGRDVAEWVATLNAFAPSTRARRVAGVRSFYTWLRDEGVVAAVPELPRSVRPRVRGQDDARLVGLSSSDAYRVMSAADEHSPRMAALVSVLFTTGLRIHEALALTAGDLRVDGGGRVTATITGKGERVRTVVIPPVAVERLDAIRPQDGGVYFRTRTGRSWDQREARDALGRMGNRLGMHLHPHILRHTAASLALARGRGIEDVRMMLGHSSLTTTQRYVRAAGNLDRTPAYVLQEVITTNPSIADH